MRKLKFHESKLLKKVDFLQWKSENNIHEAKIVRRYGLKNREEYIRYNKLVGKLSKLVAKLKKLDSSDVMRIDLTEKLLTRLYDLGLINTATSLEKAENVSASSFCRRRLAVVMCRLRMSENLTEATTLILHGHVKVGLHSITDPGYIVSRAMEDKVTWRLDSKIKRSILKYNDQVDDYDLLGN